jgi:hypothetical protein
MINWITEPYTGLVFHPDRVAVLVGRERVVDKQLP